MRLKRTSFTYHAILFHGSGDRALHPRRWSRSRRIANGKMVESHDKSSQIACNIDQDKNPEHTPSPHSYKQGLTPSPSQPRHTTPASLWAPKSQPRHRVSRDPSYPTPSPRPKPCVAHLHPLPRQHSPFIPRSVQTHPRNTSSIALSRETHPRYARSGKERRESNTPPKTHQTHRTILFPIRDDPSPQRPNPNPSNTNNLPSIIPPHPSPPASSQSTPPAPPPPPPPPLLHPRTPQRPRPCPTQRARSAASFGPPPACRIHVPRSGAPDGARSRAPIDRCGVAVAVVVAGGTDEAWTVG